jgi:hypothetical protein
MVVLSSFFSIEPAPLIVPPKVLEFPPVNCREPPLIETVPVCVLGEFTFNVPVPAIHPVEEAGPVNCSIPDPVFIKLLVPAILFIGPINPVEMPSEPAEKLFPIFIVPELKVVVPAAPTVFAVLGIGPIIPPGLAAADKSLCPFAPAIPKDKIATTMLKLIDLFSILCLLRSSVGWLDNENSKR